MNTITIGMEEDIPRHVPKITDITLADIPAQIGLFPLAGALLLPWGKLPLNVFEPRYVALLEDAISSHRLIGMIQPQDEDDDESAPDLHEIGCIGRISSFTERNDGSFAVTLSGIMRFRVIRELPEYRGYRVARIDASGFVSDLTENSPAPLDRPRLMDSLKRYFRAHRLKTSWNAIEQMEDETLLIVLPMLVPFTADEKQSLLEAESLHDRADILFALLDDTPDFPEDDS